jgi:hypothetical protein
MNDELKIGLDFDGTICTELDGTIFYKWMWKYFPRLWIEISHHLAKRTKLEVVGGSVIITGRPGWMKKLTLKQMKRWGLEDCKLYLDENKTQIGVGGTAFKIKMIRELDLDIYFENHPGVAKRIQREFPDKRIICVDYITK